MIRHLTFRQILERVADQNAARVMNRARTANHLAKALDGRARAAAYSVKHDALMALFRAFPNKVRIVRDPAQPRLLVLALGSSSGGLHLPATHFVNERNQQCAA